MMLRDCRTAMAAVLLAVWTAPVAAVEVAPEDAASLKSAHAAYKAGNYAEAAKLLAPLEAKYPAEPDIPRMLAHARFELGDFAAARRSALAAIAAGRLTPDLLGRIAQIDQRRGDAIAALGAVRLLTIVEPDNRQWRLAYADLLAAAGSLDESAAVYRTLLAEQPAAADVALRLGNVLLQQQRFAEAAAMLETAWRLGAGDRRLPLAIAGAWQSLGDDRAALDWVERANTAAARPDPNLSLQAAHIQFDLGNLDRAAQTAKLLAASAPASLKSQAHVLLGRIAAAQNNVDEAVAQWKQAAESGDANANLLAVLGAHYYNAGEYAAAAKILRRVVDAASGEHDAAERASASDPNAEQLLRFLVASLIRSGDAATARDYLRRYIEQHGLSDEAKKLIRSLTMASPNAADQDKR